MSLSHAALGPSKFCVRPFDKKLETKRNVGRFFYLAIFYLF